MGKVRKSGPRRGTKIQYELAGVLAKDLIETFKGTLYEFEAESEDKILARTKNWVTRHISVDMLTRANYRAFLPYLIYMRENHHNSTFSERRKSARKIASKTERVGSSQSYCRVVRLKNGVVATKKSILNAIGTPKIKSERYDPIDEKLIEFGPFKIDGAKEIKDDCENEKSPKSNKTYPTVIENVVSMRQRLEEIENELIDMKVAMDRLLDEKKCITRIIAGMEDLRAVYNRG